MRVPEKYDLANIPTPLEQREFESKKFLIKRDDLTGVELSGNKVRKLEYLIRDAKERGTTVVYTCGGEQSNHSRASVIAASSAGIPIKLFLWGKDKNLPDGNLFLDKVYGAEIVYLNKQEYFNVDYIMEDDRTAAEKRGEKVYIIPEGGSSPLGIWGYINFIKELYKQLPHDIEGILSASGSGGTAAGMLAGAAIYDKDIKIYAVNVLYSADEIKRKILSKAEECIRLYNLDVKIRKENLIILDGYSAEGYKNILPEKIDLMKRFARSTGLLLDPAYTGKAFAAYYQHFLNKDLGRKVIFLHSGGLFGVFGQRSKYL